MIITGMFYSYLVYRVYSVLNFIAAWFLILVFKCINIIALLLLLFFNFPQPASDSPKLNGVIYLPPVLNWQSWALPDYFVYSWQQGGVELLAHFYTSYSVLPLVRHLYLKHKMFRNKLEWWIKYSDKPEIDHDPIAADLRQYINR